MQQTAKPKRKAHIPKEICVACGCFVKVCPKNAISIYKGMYAVVDTPSCVGCGKCSRECPASIISMEEVTL